MNIYQRDEIRKTLIQEIYRHTEADVRVSLNMKKLGEFLKIDSSEVSKAYYFLKDEGLIEPMGAGMNICITHYGIKIVENLIRELNFEEEGGFNSTELFQLDIMLRDIKDHLQNLSLGQEVLYNRIDEAFEQSKTAKKKEWKNYFKNQVINWAINKTLDESAISLLEGIIEK